MTCGLYRMQGFTIGANSAELAVPINILNLERESYTVIRLLSRTAQLNLVLVHAMHNLFCRALLVESGLMDPSTKSQSQVTPDKWMATCTFDLQYCICASQIYGFTYWIAGGKSLTSPLEKSMTEEMQFTIARLANSSDRACRITAHVHSNPRCVHRTLSPYHD